MYRRDGDEQQKLCNILTITFCSLVESSNRAVQTLAYLLNKRISNCKSILAPFIKSYGKARPIVCLVCLVLPRRSSVYVGGCMQGLKDLIGVPILNVAYALLCQFGGHMDVLGK